MWDDTAPIAQIDGQSQKISSGIWHWLNDAPGIKQNLGKTQPEQISTLHIDGMGTNAQQLVVWRAASGCRYKTTPIGKNTTMQRPEKHAKHHPHRLCTTGLPNQTG